MDQRQSSSPLSLIRPPTSGRGVWSLPLSSAIPARLPFRTKDASGGAQATFKSVVLAVATQMIGRERLSALQFAAAFGVALLAQFVLARSAEPPATVIAMENRS
jgi:hypothetical protein